VSVLKKETPVMKSLALLAAALLTPLIPASAAENDARIFILSSVAAEPGKLDALHAAIRDRLIPQAAKLGVTILGTFTPLENPDGRVFYLSTCASREALTKAEQAAENDPAFAETDGILEDLADSSKSLPDRLMRKTDFSPADAPAAAKGPRIFELRTYTTTPGNLPLLHTRFREHTLALFAKHGMTNLWYWQLAKDQAGADDTLIYMLAHASADAAKASFDAFRADPTWIAAKKASEEKAGGSLTVPDGVKSILLKATDYSPLK
jgi:hypothetical protein